MPLLTSMPAQVASAPEPSSLRLSRWAFRRSIIFFVVGLGYIANVLTSGQLTLVRFLIFTLTYGAWLVIFSTQRKLNQHLPLWWFGAMAVLACLSQFLYLSTTNLNWLPILSITTACLLSGITPRYIGLIAAAVLWLSSSLAFTLSLHYWDMGVQLVLLLTFSSFLGLSLMLREIIQAQMALQHSTDQLALAHSQLQEYSAQVEEIAAIRERNRIAREIHDTLGHSLTLLAVQLETAAQFEVRGDSGLHEELQQARRVAKACLADVRHSVEALRPDGSSAGSLPERLRQLATEFTAASRDTAITLDLEEAVQPLSPDLSMTLYRCAQEALTNVGKHAGATKVLLYLSTSDGPEGKVELTVLDNGWGPASGRMERAPGFGLQGMRERVALLDGTMRAGPEPGHGWRVEVVLPIKKREQSEAIAQSSRQTRSEI
jgi:signal transduction histidine kinase